MKNGNGNGRNAETGQFEARSDPAKLTLTTKQVELVQYIANGKRTEDIALLMNTSIPAVKNQLFRIMNMTGCASRSSLVSWAFRRKLIC